MSVPNCEPSGSAKEGEGWVQHSYDVIAILVEAFDSMSGVEVTISGDKERIFRTVFGWWAFIVRSCHAVSALHRHGLGPEAGPNARAILQHALVLQWVIDVGDEALHAMEEHATENTRKLILTAREAQWSLPGDIEPVVPAKPERRHRLIGMIENFADLCIAYEARDLYVPYRLLSMSIHPTPQGAAAYVDDNGRLWAEPLYESPNLLTAAMCLIQVSRAINSLFTNDRLGDAIAQAEESIGLEVKLWSPRPGTGQASR